jgi:alpha-L-fucosidase
VRPWIVTNEENIWYTKARDAKTIYAVIFGEPDWERGERKEFFLKTVKATEDTKISVLGQSDKVVEYQPTANPTSRFEQTEEGLQISVVRAQRIYNNHKWPNPIVVKLENIKPALSPPAILTLNQARVTKDGATLKAELVNLGDAEEVQIAFRYRISPTSLNKVTSDEGWSQTETITVNKTGTYSIRLENLGAYQYQYRAVVIHSKIVIPGEIISFRNGPN